MNGANTMGGKALPGSGVAPVRDYATRFPVRFAVLVTLAFAVIDVVAALVIPRLVGDDQGLSVAQDAGQYALAFGLLASLAWWRRAGIATIPRARALLPLLPLLLFPALQALAFKLGTRDVVTILIIVEAAIAAGVTEEAVFRGVILRALEPLGRFLAAGLSAALFGLVHLVNLAAGADPLATAAQIIGAVGLGFAFAAAVFATGSIWPVIAVHAGMDLLGMLTAADVVNRQAPATAWQTLVVETVIAALFAGYGWWLLRRTTRQAAQPFKTDAAPVENAGGAGAAPTRQLVRR
jgi:membrane protease YdiL (CAAX protease family)